MTIRSLLSIPILLALLGAGSRARAEATQQRLNEIEERLDKVEKKSILDRINWSAEYRTILNAFVYRGPSPSASDLVDPRNPLVRRTINSTTEEVWSHRLRLRLSAEPISSLRFTARMVLFKHFGDSDAPPFIQDFSSTRMPRDSAARFDQLWIDWFMFEWLALSAGRIAYGEGNPNELRENSTVRRATWGLHMVDGEYETLNLTFDLSRLLKSLYLRGFYASWTFDNDDVLGGFPFLTSGTDNLRIVGGNVELVVPKLGKNFVQLGYYMVPRFRPFMIPISDPGFDPKADYTHAPAPFNQSLLYPSQMPDSLGSYQNLSALFQLYNVFGSGIDLFVSGAIGWLSPNGQGIAYELPMPNTDPVRRQSTPFLFLASEGEDGKTAFVYTGLRYTLPFLTRPKLGFEFNYGTKFMISFAMPTDQLLSKLATRGTAYEAYLIVPFNKHLFLRATYLFVDSQYQSGFFGPNPALAGSTALEFKQRIHNVQLLLDASI